LKRELSDSLLELINQYLIIKGNVTMNDMEKIETETGELLQLVSFKLGQEEFGVDILKVQEINRMLEITEVPNSPDFVCGIVNLRGRMTPVIDLRYRLGLPKKEWDNDTRIIVVVINNKTMGFIVDAVSEVLRIPKRITEAPPEIVTGIDSGYITSIGKLEDRLLILLDLNKVLSSEEEMELAEVAA
jgi:purine-binding chemotaxis protein CheW